MIEFGRFALFAGSDYYPSGGWADFVDSFDDRNKAIEIGRDMQERRFRAELGYTTSKCDWFQVVDLSCGVVICSE